MKIPIQCPSCDSSLKVSELSCTHCETTIRGNYDMPLYMQLTREEQAFILKFFLSSGSIKEMAKQAELSYPTMRNKMDDLIEKIKNLNTQKT
ncbi:DUF2089 domain-containing protein [Weeksellaceae bacterium TAE3-ERU29]|nr:DUF2089 domain-containing protein [Weeksellaceae bacterium TAE3-ERU29]